MTLNEILPSSLTAGPACALPTPVTGVRRARPIIAASALWAAAFAVLVLRRPEAVLRPQFFAESAPVFYVPTYFNDPATLYLTPYAGYLHLVPRSVAYLERIPEPLHAPMVGSLVSLGVVVAIAAFLGSDRMSGVLPAAWQRLAMAGMLLVSPSVHEILGVEVNLQVYLAVYLVALALARPSTTLFGRAMDMMGAIAAALSGPFAVLLAPLFWLRRDRLAVVVTVCAAIQFWAIVFSPQRAFEVPQWPVIAQVILLRINATVFGPTLGSIVPLGLGLVLLVVGLIIAVRTPQRRVWMAFGYAAIVIGVGGLASDGAALGVNPRWGERFFLLPSLAVLSLVLVASASRDRIAMSLGRATGALLLIGVLIDFRVPAFADVNWPVESRCIGAEQACVVRIYPDPFTLTWPGVDGTYPPPTTRIYEVRPSRP